MYIGILPLNDCCTKLKLCTAYFDARMRIIFTPGILLPPMTGVEMSLCLWCLLFQVKKANSDSGKGWSESANKLKHVYRLLHS